MGELPAMEEVEVQESVEKTTEKLVERNMLGRLAKQLQLNEEANKKCLTIIFEKKENWNNDTRPTQRPSRRFENFYNEA